MLAAIHDVLGADGDEHILEYVAGVLSDEHFDWGEAHDAIGPLLVRPVAWLPLSLRVCCKQQRVLSKSTG